METLATQFTSFDRIFLLFSVFLLAYAYSLDTTLINVYEVCC
jgi:hypothetical protein